MVRSNSPVRTDRVRKGRMVWKTLAGNINERFHEFFKYIYSHEDAYSQTEMAFIVYEKQLLLDHRLGKAELKKEDLTDSETLRLIRYRGYIQTLLSRFRMWLENEGIVLVTQKNAENGNMNVYNEMMKDKVEKYNNGLKKIVDSLIERQERQIEIAAKGRRKRIQLTERLSKEIEVISKRRNKKKYGDFGKGE